MAGQLSIRVKDIQGTEFMVSPDGRVTLMSTGRVWRPGDPGHALVMANLSDVAANAAAIQKLIGAGEFATLVASGQREQSFQTPQLPAVVPPPDADPAAAQSGGILASLPSWALPVGILTTCVVVAGGIYYVSTKKKS